MEHEMIDIYNEKGEKIGVEDKAVAHRDGLWHKSIHLWIFNTHGQVLLQKRCKDKKFYPNFWDVSVAGHVGEGEPSQESMLRETEEEIGLKVDLGQVKHAFTFKETLLWKDIISNEFVDVFVLVKDIDLNKVNLQKEEVAEVKFCDTSMIFDDKLRKDVFPHEYEYKLLKNYLDKNLFIQGEENEAL